MPWASSQTTVETPTTDVTVSQAHLHIIYLQNVYEITNTCKLAVWSNFEIGDLDLWRGEAYSKYFEFLDKKGGFYYEVRICTG